MFRFRDFFLLFLCFSLLIFLLFFTICGCCFLFRLLFSSGCHALSDVLPHFSNPGFSILRLNMSAKNSCKNTEYETFDFGSFGPNRTPTQKGKMNTKEIERKQDPNAEGKNDPEKNTKKKHEKNEKKNWTSSSQPKKNKNLEHQEKPRVFCILFAFFVAFFVRFVCVVFCVFFCVLFFLCVFLVFFLLFFSPLSRGRCFCARRPWRPKSLM